MEPSLCFSILPAAAGDVAAWTDISTPGPGKDAPAPAWLRDLVSHSPGPLKP